MKKLQIIKTSDGSYSIFNPEINEIYHSCFGAIQESRHIFIEAGLGFIQKPEISVLEVGFGTGLNALLAQDWANRNKKKINYFGVEAFPVPSEIISQLNYCKLLSIDKVICEKLHSAKGVKVILNPYFSFEVQYKKLQEIKMHDNQFDVVFFDAFSSEVQPEMWEEHVFRKIENAMKRGGVLTTYSCKGIVKRAMISVGFSIQKLPGPPGKREFLRAIKL